MPALLVVLALAAATPPADAELLDQAEAAFAEGLRLREKGERGAAAFRAAARAYETLNERGAANADLYRNLGNAYWLAGDAPRSILAYRLGLRLAPQDGELRQLLAGAREQVVYPPSSTLGRPAEEVRPRWLALIPPGWLFAAAVLVYVGGCVCLTRWMMIRHPPYLAEAVVALVVALGLGGWSAWSRWDGLPRPIAVIARDGVLLRKGNGAAFPPWSATPLNRGVEAEVLHDRDGWLQVELAGGEIGWVSEAEVVRESREQQ